MRQTESSYSMPGWIDQWSVARRQGVTNMLSAPKAREILFGLDVLTLAASKLVGHQDVLFLPTGEYRVNVGTTQKIVGEYTITEHAGFLTIALTPEATRGEINKDMQLGIEEVLGSATPPEPAKLMPYEMIGPVLESIMPAVENDASRKIYSISEGRPRQHPRGLEG